LAVSLSEFQVNFKRLRKTLLRYGKIVTNTSSKYWLQDCLSSEIINHLSIVVGLLRVRKEKVEFGISQVDILVVFLFFLAYIKNLKKMVPKMENGIRNY